MEKNNNNKIHKRLAEKKLNGSAYLYEAEKQKDAKMKQALSDFSAAIQSVENLLEWKRTKS